MALVDAGGFSVEYDDIQKLIAILKDHQHRLADRLAKVNQYLVTPPPGKRCLQHQVG